ncbi:MAG: TatD family hydrolase [Dactylosporangium sp.]|nr:TatD family hydrolase [Dactylosporangium sp.]NNJ61699.1 TatD family hydrolase [Dactylosporangium sp.]
MSTSRRKALPPSPDPLPIPVPDSHTHLDLTLADADGGGLTTVAEAVDRAAATGIDRMVQIGIDVPSSRWAASVAAEHPAVLATVALHPNEAPRLADLDAALREIESLAASARVRGIGETGLDYYRTGVDGRAAQHESFRAHVGLAKRAGKALVIHDREAHDDVLRVLDAVGAPDTVVMHCFSGDEDFARECVRRGYVLSFAGNVTFANAGALRDAARATPLGQLMVETDAPFLTPVPYRGRPNASYLVPLIVRVLAEAKGVDIAELCASLSATTERVFGPWTSDDRPAGTP